MSLISKIIDGKEYMLFEGGYTKAQAKKRAKQIRNMVRVKHHISVRAVPYEGKYAVFTKMSPALDLLIKRDIRREIYNRLG